MRYLHLPPSLPPPLLSLPPLSLSLSFPPLSLSFSLSFSVRRGHGAQRNWKYPLRPLQVDRQICMCKCVVNMC